MAELQVDREDKEHSPSRLPNQEFVDEVEQDLDKELTGSSRAGFIRKVTIHLQTTHF